MKIIYQYIKQYFKERDKKVLVSISFFTAILIFINYHFGLDDSIRKNSSFAVKLFSWYTVFAIAFSIPYFFTSLFKGSPYFKINSFLLLLFTAPFIFALKISLDISFNFTDNLNPVAIGWNNYWNHILYWPLLLLIVAAILWLRWRYFDKDQPFYGLTKKNLAWKPYLLMLLFMIPLVAAASTQADFLAVYPKLKSVTDVYTQGGLSFWHKLLFEVSYGSDFISIELFFRGFLILAFIKWAGKDAILPMACFYCTIHFGKPLGECISSYFGGMVLGVVVYHTRSIYGGLLIHLGIAWLMELGGYLGNNI